MSTDNSHHVIANTATLSTANTKSYSSSDASANPPTCVDIIICRQMNVCSNLIICGQMNV